MFLLYLTKIPHVPICISCPLASHSGSVFPRYLPIILLQASARSLICLPFLQLKKPSLLGGHTVLSQPSCPSSAGFTTEPQSLSCTVLPEHNTPDEFSSTRGRRISFLELLAPCLHRQPNLQLGILRKLEDVFHKYYEGLFFSFSLS